MRWLRPAKKAGHNMPVLVGAHGQLDLVAVAVRVGCAQHVRHRYVQLAQPRKGVPYKLGLGGALGLIADMPQPAAAAGAGDSAVHRDAVRRRGEQFVQDAEGIPAAVLHDAHPCFVPGGGAGDKYGLAIGTVGHTAAVAGKAFDAQGQDLVFL